LDLPELTSQPAKLNVSAQDHSPAPLRNKYKIYISNAHHALPRQTFGRPRLHAAKHKTMTGKLYLVSVGPGSRELIPPMVEQALAASDVIVAYDLYLTWIQPWISGKDIRTLPLTQERDRAQLALEEARAGKTVALISSGDIGIYAMATLATRTCARTIPSTCS
jgi:hypothetical protein